MSKLVYGLDFGTSNSAVAVLQDGKLQVLPISQGGKKTTSSVIYFPGRGGVHYVGDEAILKYVGNGMRGRFIQSIKSVLPDTLFTGTVIMGHGYFKVEDLVALILANLKACADKITGSDVRSVVMGRPAVYSDKKDEEEIAEERLIAAARLAGFEEIHLQIEPIAAALYYEVSLSQPQLALVADFGGGTSDFTLMRLSPDKAKLSRRQDDVIATAGVHIAGDDFDSAIMWHKLVKYFGANIRYESSGAVLGMPAKLMRTICEWQKISFLKNSQDQEFIRQLLYLADDKDAVRRLHTLIEKNLGFSLFQAIEGAKCDLSTKPESEIIYSRSEIDISEPITREEFDRLISDEVSKIEGCLDKLLADSGVAVDDIDSIFLTGGTSRTPLIQVMLERKFGAAKMRMGDAFISVVSGLALSHKLFFNGGY